MRGMLGWLIVAMSLAGCASMWVERPKDDATYAHDRILCHAEAHTFAMMAHDPSYRRMLFATRMRRCMQARGWPFTDE
jgi:hypothetical protein